MTEIQKASAWFNSNDIRTSLNDDQLYIIVGEDIHVLVSTSEIIYRAELHDEGNW